jgi:hypothetical protein
MTGLLLESPIAPASIDLKRQKRVLLWFGVLQLLDLATTLVVFSRGGVELNPLICSFMPWTGKIPAVFLSKALLVLIGWRFSHRVRAIGFGNGFYAGVVVWNIIILWFLR